MKKKCGTCKFWDREHKDFHPIWKVFVGACLFPIKIPHAYQIDTKSLMSEDDFTDCPCWEVGKKDWSDKMEDEEVYLCCSGTGLDCSLASVKKGKCVFRRKYKVPHDKMLYYFCEARRVQK